MSKKNDWGTRLKDLRDSYGWSQRDLAEEFYVTRGAVGHWESGAREMLGPVKRLIELYEEKLEEE